MELERLLAISENVLIAFSVGLDYLEATKEA